MWPVLLCLIIGAGVTIDRIIALRKAKINVPAFMVRIRGLIKRKDVEGAIKYCHGEKSPASNIIRKGLKKYGQGHERVKDAIESSGSQEVAKLEKGLSILAAVAGTSPLLGFLGTITGLMSAFMRIQNLHGAANPGDLAGAIWEALVPAAFGLIVGIPLLIFYNYFAGKVKRLVADMEAVANDVIDVLYENAVAKTDVEEELEIDS